MMKIRTVFQIIKMCGAILTAFGIASTAQASYQVSGVSVTKLSIYAGAGGAQGAVVQISSALPSGTEGCTYNPANLLWIDFASTIQPDGKSLYATLMAAYMAGHQVTFGVAGCGDAGQLPLIYRVDVLP